MTDANPPSLSDDTPAVKSEPDAELDASIENDIDMTGTAKPDAMNLDGAADADPAGVDMDPVAPGPEPRVPSKKESSLREFISKMDDYAPIVGIAFICPDMLSLICF